MSKAVITGVELVNFRPCRNVRLSVDAGLTVLVGANNSGKSTLLQGISYASQATRGNVSALFSESRDVRLLRSSGVTGPMELAICSGNKEFRVTAEPAKGDTKFATSDNGSESLFGPSVLLRLQSGALASPSDVVGRFEPEPGLSADGYGLPTVLAHLALTDPRRLETLVNQVRQMVPAVEQIRHSPVRRRHPHSKREGPEFQCRLEVKMEGAGWVPAEMLSEGVLFALGIHAVLSRRVPPRILLIDDIERGLHPKAQRAVVFQFRQACQGDGPQIVLSTHSPYVLDDVPPEAVRVVHSNEGRTQLRALVEHPEWQGWKGSMTPGEFWTYVGEDWPEKAQ